MTSYVDETVTIDCNFWCHPRVSNPSPSACKTEAMAMSTIENNKNFFVKSEIKEIQQRILIFGLQ